jgi:ribosomal protein S18 acetylase RimI-like enzyme
MMACCLCIDSPGRTSSIFIPSSHHLAEGFDAALLLLEQAAAAGRERGIRLLQAIVDPQSQSELACYRAAGFEPLSRLLYLESELPRPLPRDLPGADLQWTSYSDAVHEQFARAIQATYEDSLDCTMLNGHRHIDDVIAGHKATGRFDPRFWLLARRENEPVGVLLLAHLPERGSWEVVYMGVLPGHRRQGIARTLVRRAFELVREQGAARITLSVDARNHRAMALYENFGFVETLRREAYIKMLP